jgi:cytochrome bd-type quinol oxidase subunit 2
MTEDSYLLLAQVLLISLVLLILWLIYKGTHRILSAQHIEKAEKISTYLLAGLICWLLLTGLVSLSGFFTNFEELPPRIALAMLPPVFVTIYLLFSRS